MDALNWLAGSITEPLQYGFVVRALFASIMVGVICPIVGSYMILRGMAFFGDALSHAVLPGLAVAEAASASVSAVRWARLTRADAFMVFSQTRTVEPSATRNNDEWPLQRCGASRLTLSAS